ncbi:glycosyltransferase family 8 protein [Annulohypoxylon truncatum]|uniref:glycosyltransferase family 8 protein n=1 Tax=Annulohypoxylon truncatum TaxID=327061 RepID=UPI0020072056|nr:glycosyltransferase family 8 protein [Annulohypoxylon truncatum]KAI1205961.1 glycosyltransferase family 8 protein [Annulohypoxylon truncatum]
MAVQGGGAEEDVYATLLLSDTYLPGALVLAHSLRDAGTTKKLAVLITLDTVSAEVITELKNVYDYVIPVSRITNSQPSNLQLMNRADLHSAFTKITLWKQTQFRKIVYIDSDVVAYQAPDELFDITHPFSAAPDIGWPDLFNTGVMVLSPNETDYQAMAAMAAQNTSFDGADQGLINMHFGSNYNRLSFAYNVTPSGHYQYVPAYRHFQSNIKMVHFIGPEKPWFKGRRASTGSSPFDEMVGKWWAVYDKHYGGTNATSTSIIGSSNATKSGSELVQYFTTGEYQYRHQGASAITPSSHSNVGQTASYQTAHRPQVTQAGYDHPEGFVPFFDPDLPKPIFPWEAHRERPSRVWDDDYLSRRGSIASIPETPTIVPSIADLAERSEPPTPTMHPIDTWSAFTLTNAWDEIPEIERYAEKFQQHRRRRSTKSPGPPALPADDADIPHRRRQGSKVTDFPSETERPSLPVTPAPIHPGVGSHNPLLPAAENVPGQAEWVCSHGRRWAPADCLCDVTNILHYHKDPVVQLQKLAKQQSELLLRKLGSGDPDSSELPSRLLPFGSDLQTYVAQTTKVFSPQPLKGGVRSAGVYDIDSNLEPTPSVASTVVGDMLEPSYTGPGPAFEKGEIIFNEDVPTPRTTTPQPGETARASGIPQPSYAGPGPAFEKGEVISTGE